MGCSESVRPWKGLAFHFSDISEIGKATRLSILHTWNKNSSLFVSNTAFVIFLHLRWYHPLFLHEKFIIHRILKLSFFHEISQVSPSRHNPGSILSFLSQSLRQRVPWITFYHFPACYLFFTITDAIWKWIVLLLAFLFLLHLLSYRMLDAWGQGGDFLFTVYRTRREAESGEGLNKRLLNEAVNELVSY